MAAVLAEKKLDWRQVIKGGLHENPYDLAPDCQEVFWVESVCVQGRAVTMHGCTESVVWTADVLLPEGEPCFEMACTHDLGREHASVFAPDDDARTDSDWWWEARQLVKRLLDVDCVSLVAGWGLTIDGAPIGGN